MHNRAYYDHNLKHNNYDNLYNTDNDNNDNNNIKM